jgi:hypothetical protein
MTTSPPCIPIVCDNSVVSRVPYITHCNRSYR